MLLLVLFILLLAVVLAVALWGGSLFAQSYLYTEPASGLLWRAPAAAGILAFFYLFWSVVNYVGGDRATGEVPYPVLWEFTNRTYLVSNPVPQIESKKLRGEPAVYKLDKTQRPPRYKRADGGEYWDAPAVEWIKLMHDGKEYKFEPKSREGRYQLFVDRDNGWEMKEVELGRPSYSSSFRLVFYFFLNGVHLLVWLACAWLLLRFHLSAAIALGFVMWLVFTLIVFPVLFARVEGAVRVAQLVMPLAELARNWPSGP